MANNMVDDLKLNDTEINRKCKDCIKGCQTCRPFDGDKKMELLELVSFDLWGPSHVPSAGGKTYMMIVVDAGTSHKYGAYLADKLDSTTINTFKTFCSQAETMTSKKLCRIYMDRDFDTVAWKTYCQQNSIIHGLTALYSSSQNGLAERMIRTTIDDVHTLLLDSGLGHSYWAEAAAYSIYTCNLIPSCQAPGCIPLKLFTGQRTGVGYLQVFGSKCWVKIPTANGLEVNGESKPLFRSF